MAGVPSSRDLWAAIAIWLVGIFGLGFLLGGLAGGLLVFLWWG